MDNLVLVNTYTVGIGCKSLCLSADPAWIQDAQIELGDSVFWCRKADSTNLYLRKSGVDAAQKQAENDAGIIPTIERTITVNGHGNARVVIDTIWARLQGVQHRDRVGVYRIPDDNTYLVYRKIGKEDDREPV